jgi:hypothetical protein
VFGFARSLENGNCNTTAKHCKGSKDIAEDECREGSRATSNHETEEGGGKEKIEVAPG